MDTRIVTLFCLMLFTVSVYGSAMTFVNMGHGCPTRRTKCHMDCVKDGWALGFCHKVFCLCWPSLRDSKFLEAYKREFDEKIRFPEFDKPQPMRKVKPKVTPKP